MIRIAYTIGTLLTGGAEVFVVNLIKNLNKSKFEVLLIVLDKKNNTFLEEQLENLGIKVIYISKNVGFSFKSMIQIYKLLKNFKPDIIHGNIGGIIYVLLYLIFNRKSKAIHTCHTLAKVEFGKFKRIILRYFYKRRRIVPVVITISNFDEFIETYKIDNKLVKVVSNGVDIEKFYTSRDFSYQAIRLGHVGRFEEVKNHKTIVLVYEKLKALGHEVSLRLVGKGSLLKTFKEKLIDENVLFIEETSKVEEELSKIDFFLFPSLYEGMPLSLIEAMASGCVIIASNVGGIKGLIEDGVNGYKFDYNDIDSYVNTIEYLSLNLDKMKEISNNNKNKSKLFSLEKMVNKYEELYLKEVN